MTIKITDKGHNNQVDIAQDVAQSGTVQVLITGNDNHLTIGPGTRLTGVMLEIRNARSRMVIGAGCLLSGQLRLRANDTTLEIGAGTTMQNAQVTLHEAGRIAMGRDCMLSGNIVMDVSDMHSILDAETGARINPPRDIELGDHVWLAQGVQVMKGARIGTNSMIGARSLVVGDIPPGSLAAGVPARVLRTGVTWDRRRLPWG